ncbi:MAG: hypothetical protein H7A47_00875 [Verrucomicrobiales bacterium]|nr:hypothetical protein [Verrucomicrobiales bacterium]
MQYFHVFWTPPLLNPARAAAEQEIFVWDFEALVWLLSALELRRHSAIRLITDTRGLQFVRGAGLEWVYPGGISTGLDDFPAGIDPGVFWSAGKIAALRQVEPPCVWIDLDLVLWHPLAGEGPLTALHWEDREWAWYRPDRESFGRDGFFDVDWSWEAHPVNTGLLRIADRALHELYTLRAIDFMRRYSEAGPSGAGATTTGLRNDPTVFAEQRLLSMCAARLGLRIEVLTECAVPGLCLPPNPHCLHLWGTKAAYRACPEARMALVNHLCAEIRTRFPEAGPTLDRWGLTQPCELRPPPPEEAWEILRASAGELRFSLLRNIRGVVWVEDPNVGVRRRAVDGSVIWSGETIRPDAGAGFDLVVAEGRSVRCGAGRLSRSCPISVT